MITRELLKEYLNYNPDTGIFVWIKKPPRSHVLIGSEAGSFDGSDGYRRIQLFRKAYRVHRLAFLYMDGTFPEQLVDHVNGVVDDNRWTNLRRATYSQNCKNTKSLKSNTIGFRGIYKSGNRWIARAMLNRKFHYLGCFPTPNLASKAYEEFAKMSHGEFYKNPTTTT